MLRKMQNDLFSAGVNFIVTALALILCGVFALRRKTIHALVCLACFIALFRPSVALSGAL
jgi:hypothetical membrane protein